MSPHVLVMPLESPQPKSLNLLRIAYRFSISGNGFLPAKSPLDLLPNHYYQPWEAIAHNLPALVESGICEAVIQLPLLDTDRLISEAEWQRAYVILAFTANAYIWSGNSPREVLPPQITIPFLRVAAHFELPPVLTYAAANLWNFSCRGRDFSDIDNLKTLVSFTGTESESWFFLISVAIEAKCAGIIEIVMAAFEAVKTRDYNVIIEALEQLGACIQDAAALMDRMYEKCDPMVFYHHIRPFLAGSLGMEGAGLPRGIFYDEGHGKGRWRQLRGGSNGQSSLIHFFDIVLGINHSGHSCAGTTSYHDEVRGYMPGDHRRFLSYIARLDSIRDLAMSVPTTPEQHRLQETFTAVIGVLRNFRSKHIQIVTRYVILPSKQPWEGTRQNLASLSSACGRDEQLTGTGGTILLPFLKQAREETAVAGRA